MAGKSLKRDENSEEYERYIAQREGHVEGRFRVAEQFDKTLLALSGGALGISMTFIRDIAPYPTFTLGLVLAWIFFGTSLAILLVSMYACQLAYEKERKILDDAQVRTNSPAQEKQPSLTAAVGRARNQWTKLTEVSNVAGMVFFLLGLVFLFIFVCRNMENSLGDDSMHKQPSIVKPEPVKPDRERPVPPPPPPGPLPERRVPPSPGPFKEPAPPAPPPVPPRKGM